MWATGCVFAEMLRGESLFPGNTDIEQLALVVRTLGTPSTRNWPDVINLPDYNKIRYLYGVCRFCLIIFFKKDFQILKVRDGRIYFQR